MKHNNGNGVGMPLAIRAKMFPTPTAADAKSSGGQKCPERPKAGTTLTDAGRAWPTPTAHDAKGTGPSQMERHSLMLGEAARLWPTPMASTRPDPTTPTPGPASKRVLNPRFVCWLMGLPADWTWIDCAIAPTSYERWGTALSRRLSQRLSSSCGIG